MRKLTITIFIIGMMMVLTSISNAANVTWLSAVSGNWNDGTKWSGGSAPTVNDTAIINVAGTYTVTLNVNASIAKLELGNATGFQLLTATNRTLTIASASTINPHGTLELYQTTLNGAGTLIANGKLRLIYNNVITSNLVINDTLHITHSTNNINGTFTTSATSVILMDASASHSTVTFANGFANNGKIHMKSATCNYNYLTVTSGVLLNAAGGAIVSDPLPNCVGYNRLDARLNNQGTMTINYTLQHTSTALGSENSGTITVANGALYQLMGGVWNYSGGSITGTGNGSLYFQNTTANFNNTTMPNVYTQFYQSTFASITGTTNQKKVTLIYNNSVTANFNNADTLNITHQSNNITGNFSNTASSVILMDASASHSVVTFSNSFTNNGKIHMKSATCNYNYLIVTNPSVLTNAAAGLIVSDPLPNCVGYNRIDGRINNQGTITVNYTLRHYSTAAGSDNTGTINVANGTYYGVFAGVWNYNGGTINATGNGYLYFENTTANFNVATMPNVETQFYQSTLASTSLPITNNRVIKLIYNNTVSAAIYNTDTIKVEHQSNTMTGALTTAPTSVLLFNAAQSHSVLTVTSGWTNNGKILFTSATCNYGYLIVSSGVLINAASGTIQSDPNPNCVGYHRMDAALNNQGTVNVNYTFRHYTNAGTSNNIGVINFSNGYNLEVYNGTWNWDGGSMGSVGASKIIFQNATAKWNTATMPPIVTYYYQSTLASNLSGIANSKKVQLSYQNTVSANLNNADTIEVVHQTNTFSGNYTNTSSSLLLFDAAESHSILTFNNSFTNNGKIKFISATCNYGYLLMNSGQLLTNAAAGIIQSDPNPNCVGYHRIDAAINNLGAINVNYTLRHYTNPGASTSTGTINFTNGYNLEVYNGTWNWDGGTASSATSKIIFQNATAKWNTATMPPIVTYYYQSTLASNLAALSNTKKIQIAYNNTVTANLLNTDTVEVRHASNVYSGNFSTINASVLWFNGAESNSVLTFNNSFTNNGKIIYNSTTCNYGYLSMSNGTQLTNAASGVIQSDPNPNCIGYHRMDAALNNLGTVNVNYTFRHYTNPGTSYNTGTVTILTGTEYQVYNGTFHWNGGTGSGNGLFSFNSVTASFNTDTIPNVFTYFNLCDITSTLTNITNARKVRIAQANDILVNFRNSDSVLVQNAGNDFLATYTNSSTSVLWFDGTAGHSVMNFSNSFTNNGKILFQTSCNYGYLTMSGSTTLTNASGASIVINPNPNCIGFHRMEGNISNNGLIAINYQWYHSTGLITNNNGGTIMGTAQLNNLNTRIVNDGTISPGASPGILQMNAKIRNNATSVWNIEIGGLTAGTQHDQIDNNFTSTYDSINGTLNITLINGFIPSLGDSVIIEKHLSSVGTFSNITGQAIPGGLYWNIFYRPNRIVLRAGNPPNLDIVSSTGANGAISPLGTTSVTYNGTQTYNIIPNTNYHVQDVLVDGVSVGAVTSYTFSNVIVNHTISVTFALNTWNIIATTSGNGTISPSGTVVVNAGNNQTFNITANPCNLIDSVIVDGVYQGTSSSYTFTNVIANHTIHTVFRTAPRITASGATTFCAGGSVTLDAGAGYTNYQWSNSASTQTTTVNTSGTYVCTITSTGGCTSSTSVVVTVNPLPSVSFTNPYSANANHVCVTDGGIGLNGFGLPLGGSYSGNGVSNLGFGNYGFTPSTAGVNTHALTYSYTDGNGCSNSATTNIIVDQNATVNAGADIILCNNPLANLSGTIGGSASSSTWSSNGTGNFGNANALNTTYTLSAADMTAGTVTLTLTTNDPANTCGAVNDQLVITYNPDAIADAGPSVACVTSPVTVSGSISGYPATPQWTSTGTGAFANANSLTTTYTPSVADLTAGNVYLILTPIDPLGNCTFTADSMQAWFNPNYSVNAGADVILCGVNDTIAILNGSFANATSVVWTTNGSGTFANANAANTTYTLSSSDKINGAIVLTLTTNDPTGPCTAASDVVVVKYKYVIADAGVDVCGDTSTAVTGSVITNSLTLSTLNYLWTTAGTGNFTNANNPSTTYNASNADLSSGQTKVYFNLIDGAGECTYAKDSIIIYYNQHYTVNAGIDTAVCSNEVLNISGTSNAPLVTWTTSGTGTFGNANILTTTYTPSSADSLAGSVVLTLTTNDPAGPCVALSDNMSVIIHPAPAASAGNNTPICNGTALNLTATGGTSYAWTGPNGFTSSQQNIVIPNSTVTMSGTYNVVVTNNFGCSNPASTVVIVNPCGCIAPSLLQTHTDVNCFGGSDGSIDITAVGGSGGNTFLWSNNATTEDISGLTAGTYTVTVTASGGCTASTSITLAQGQQLPPVIIAASGPIQFCVGGSVSLNAGSGWSIYNWSNGQHTQGINVSTTGNYFVNVINSAGCTAYSDTVAVLSTSKPTASTKAVTGPEAVCLGNSYPFTIRSVARAQYYTWQAPAGVLINGNVAPFNTPDTAVVITFLTTPALPYSGWNICVSASNICGTSNSKCLFTRYGTSVPSSIIGSSEVCLNNTYIYKTKSVEGGHLYRWTAPAGALINGQASPYTSSDTAVSVTFTNSYTGGSLCVSSSALGCVYSDERCLVIRAVPLTPTGLTGQKTGVCNATYGYSCNVVAGAAGYKWTAPAGVLINGLASPVTTVIPSANFTFANNFNSGSICVQAVNSCNALSGSACFGPVTGKPAKPSVINGPLTACANQNNVLYSTSGITGAAYYTWTVPVGATFTGQNTTAINAHIGTGGGSVTVKAGNTCGVSAVTSLNVAVNCREGESAIENSISIYPNPSREFVNIEMHSALQNTFVIVIKDAQGRVVQLVEQKTEIGENTFKLNISEISQGIYFVEIMNNGVKSIHPIIKE